MEATEEEKEQGGGAGWDHVKKTEMWGIIYGVKARILINLMMSNNITNNSKNNNTTNNNNNSNNNNNDNIVIIATLFTHIEKCTKCLKAWS